MVQKVKIIKQKKYLARFKRIIKKKTIVFVGNVTRINHCDINCKMLLNLKKQFVQYKKGLKQ